MLNVNYFYNLGRLFCIMQRSIGREYMVNHQSRQKCTLPAALIVKEK